MPFHSADLPGSKSWTRYADTLALSFKRFMYCSLHRMSDHETPDLAFESVHHDIELNFPVRYGFDSLCRRGGFALNPLLHGSPLHSMGVEFVSGEVYRAWTLFQINLLMILAWRLKITKPAISTFRGIHGGKSGTTWHFAGLSAMCSGEGGSHIPQEAMAIRVLTRNMNCQLSGYFNRQKQ